MQQIVIIYNTLRKIEEFGGALGGGVGDGCDFSSIGRECARAEGGAAPD